MEARKGGRAGLLAYLATVLGAGAACGVAAAMGAGPFSVMRPPPVVRFAAQHPADRPLDASLLFPPPSPAVIHRQVDVYDPAPPAASAPPAAAAQVAPRPATTAQPAPAPTAGDDGGGGGGTDT